MSVEVVEDKEADAERFYQEAVALTEVISELQGKCHALYLAVSKATCPYAVGDVLQTNKGLGTVGLVLQEIVAPVNPSKMNRWAISTFAMSKTGEVTKRAVGVDEAQIIGGLTITRKE